MSGLSDFKTTADSTEEQTDDDSGSKPSRTYPDFYENKHPVAYALMSQGGHLREAPKDTEYDNISNFLADLIPTAAGLLGDYDENGKLTDPTGVPISALPQAIEALVNITLADAEGDVQPALEFFEPSEEEIRAYLENREDDSDSDDE